MLGFSDIFFIFANANSLTSHDTQTSFIVFFRIIWNRAGVKDLNTINIQFFENRVVSADLVYNNDKIRQILNDLPKQLQIVFFENNSSVNLID